MPTIKGLEVNRIRGVADNFRALILKKQAAFDDKNIDYFPEDLVKGTPYEDGVKIKNNIITYTTPMDKYKWWYVPRVGDTPALLIEIEGFIKGV